MKDNIQFLLILGLFGYIIFLQQCKGGSSSSENEISLDTIIRVDTILPAPVIVNLPRQRIPEPVIFYVDSSKTIIPTAQVDTNQHIAVNNYQDSLTDENLTIYYNSLVDGQLLDHHLGYKLKVPKRIVKTIEIPTPVPTPANSIFLTTGVGGNPNQFASVTVGLEFVSSKGWSLGYEYDILQNSHNAKLGIRLWRQGMFKRKKKLNK